VPLGWLNVENMAKDANPQDREEPLDFADSQTVEFRCPDGSANVHFLLAGLAVAARHGLEMEGALDLADKLYVDVNIFSPEHRGLQETLPQLPASCWESSESLLKDRQIYERDGVFSPVVVDGLVKTLRSYNDKDLSERYYGMGDEIKKLVDEYFNC
ncbi:MAG: glutamine synthetase, partial [Dehalococcoidia bacterium]|nr:glutamine synthetase [Dehalococcoidia bacterium]